MTERASVRLLADVPEVIATLATWYKKQWPAWFRAMPLVEIEADFRNVANRDRLPIGLVAFDAASQVLAVCSIRDHPFEPYPHLSPWLRGLYVHAPYRGRGVAEELIAAACEYAARLQIGKLYAATHSAVSTFERAGWLGLDQVLHEDQTLTIFAKRVG